MNLRRIVATVLAITTITTSAVGITANAATTTVKGSASYGSCEYILYVGNYCYTSGELINNSNVTRFATVKIYLASHLTGTPTSDPSVSTSRNVESETSLEISEFLNDEHDSSIAHYYEGKLYGSAYGVYIPVVETKHLNISHS